MRRKTILALSFALLLVSIGVEEARAYDNYALFKQANTARDLGDPALAIRDYQDYIATHPFTQDVGFPVPSPQNNQYLLRNLLLAYDNLFDVLRESGRSAEINFWLQKLKNSYQPEKFGSKNIYNLARLYQKNNFPDDSTALLETIVTRQQEEYLPGNNKVLLRAAALLAKLYKKQGKQEQQRLLFQTLAQCSTAEFDNKDRLKIAALYQKDESTRIKSEQLLMDILNQAGKDQTVQPATALQAGILLMRARFQQKDKQGLNRIADICQQNINHKLSPGGAYKLAVAFLKYDKKEQGKNILAEISKKHPNTLWARKSLFLLGRTAMSEENWNAAISYYSTYMERYPEQTFFCLKAYSNILDAYWARDGDLAAQQIQINRFADILNQTSDYETLLNMARELHFKGFDQLANATFTLGYTSAQDTVLKNSDSLEAIRANWQLTKYAIELGRPDLARESGESVIKQHALISPSLADINEQERAGYYLSKTYLWLARLYEETDHNKLKAMEILQRYRDEFPEDSDIDYATFQLGRLYEENQQRGEAAVLYKQINKGRWKKKAAHALHRVGGQ